MKKQFTALRSGHATIGEFESFGRLSPIYDQGRYQGAGAMEGKAMKNTIDDLMTSLGPDVVAQISNTLGIDRRTLCDIIPQLTPLILISLKRQKDEHGGMDRIDQILNKYGSDQILDDLPAFLAARAGNREADSSMGGLLGHSGPRLTELLSIKFNLDSATAGRIIPTLAPIILGFLSRRRRQSGIGLSGVSAILDQIDDCRALDDISGFLLKTEHPSQADSVVLAKLLRGLTSKKR